jgi:cyclohexa-1,5-dienecarbonyl-CoA hydratase
MPAGYKDIQFSVTERAARIVLSRPPLNVLTISMMKEIADAVNRVSSMPEVCAIVLSASPSTRAFSAGTSVEEHRPETVYQMLEAFHSIFRAMNIASKPVVAAVAGAALGGGCELVAFADIVIATHSARFGQPEIKIGVFPPVSSIILPRAIGEKKAREMILTGDLITAEEARQLGLVNYVVGEAELEQKTKEVLDKLRQMSAPALEMSRRAIAEAWGLPFEEALKRTEDIYLNQLMSHRDPTEGIQAFIEKRAPQWKHK